MNNLIFENRIKIKLYIKILILGNFIGNLPLPSLSQEYRYQFSSKKMGSNFDLIFYTSDSLKAQLAAKHAYLIVDSLNSSFSDYNTDSEINRLSRLAQNEEWNEVSEDLKLILAESERAWKLSHGAFDVTIGKLSKLWRICKKSKILTNSDTLKKALKTVGMNNLLLHENKILFKQKGTEIDLGGIGKGYAAEKVKQYLGSINIDKCLVDAAGNMAIGMPPPKKTGWNIAIEIPNSNGKMYSKILKLANCAVSTSGDAFQYVEIDGKRYSHILNAKTGLGLLNSRQVTVICENATIADWLSTACCSLSIKASLALLKTENAECLMFYKKNKKLISLKSEYFDKFSGFY